MADAGGNTQKFGLLPDVPIGEDIGPTTRTRGDGLDRKAFVEVLGRAAIETPDTLTIGVYGDWGVGKTSVMMLMKRIADGSDRAVGVWFNAWQYEREEHLIVPLIATISKALEGAKSGKDGSKRLDVKFKDAADKMHKALRAVAYGFSFKGKVDIPLLAGAEFNLSGKDMVERYEKLSESYKELANEAVLDRSLYFDAFEKLRQASTGEPDTPKIVVFVDDLDRCLPEAAVSLLENIKLVMSLPNFSFVLGLAPKIVEQYVKKTHYADLDLPPGYLDHYLEKFIQLPFYVPAAADEVMEEHIANLTSNAEVFTAAEIEQWEPVRPILTLIAEKNPRAVVRQINQIIVLKRVADLPGGTEPIATTDLAFAIVFDEIRDALLNRQLVIPKEAKGVRAGKDAPDETGLSPSGRAALERDWPEFDAGNRFSTRLASLIETYIENATDIYQQELVERLKALAEINSHPSVSQALSWLSDHVAACRALHTDDGLAWLRHYQRMSRSIELTRTVQSEEEAMLYPYMPDWFAILASRENPLSITDVVDYLIDGHVLPLKIALRVEDLTPLRDEFRPSPPMTAWDLVDSQATLSTPRRIQRLSLSGCKNVLLLSPLQGVSGLVALDLRDCTGLIDLSPLSSIASLKEIRLAGCTGISEDEVDSLKRDRPDLKIYGP